MMDCNDSLVDGRFRTLLESSVPELEEFSHKWWGSQPPATHVNGSLPIDGCFKPRDIEVTNLVILPILDSPGDHRSFIFDIASNPCLAVPLLRLCD